MFIDVRERGGAREKRERDQYERETLIGCLPRDQTHNVGMCPDWGSNPKPFGVRHNASTI